MSRRFGRVSSKSGKRRLPASSAIATGLATRYATALLELALEQKKVDEVARDLGTVETMLGESDELQRLVASPVLSRDEQAGAMEALAGRAGLGKLVSGFLGVLAQKRRTHRARADHSLVQGAAGRASG